MKILSVGRIAPVKNLEIIIRAVALSHVRLTIAGEPAVPGDEAYLRTLKNLGGPVTFIGKVAWHDLPALYRSHDIFVHTSKTGSLDKTLLEAMACGMAVVSCNDAARGFLPASWIFSPDDANELAEKILNHPQENFDVRQYVVEHHDLKKLIASIAKLL
jgi:glycosyltransferase involved in cell wall biosynthesis